MINTDLILYLLLPLFLSAGTIFILHRLVPRITPLQSTGAAVAGLAISALIITAFFYTGKGSKTFDEEIWNGEILSKTRTQGSYVRSYDCHCRTVTMCSGSGKNRSCSSSQSCQTCYEDHYTVDWSCKSNIGGFNIDDEDSTSRSVYALPDPPRYTIINRGDPVSKVHSYTNFIKAVPDTLFRPASATLKTLYAGKIPAYPIGIYDIYHVDRVIAVDIAISNIREWNDKLSSALKVLGPAKQANAVIVLTKYGPDYFYALQDAWLNGKKNDIVLVIGAPNYPSAATWVRVMALTQDDLFQVKLRDDILALEKLTPDSVIDVLSKDAMSNFKRKHMADFAYLDAEIDPPVWVMWVCMSLIVAAYLGFWYYIWQNNDFRSGYAGPR